MSISVLAQTKFNTSLSEIFYRNIVKVEARTATNTVLHANGDEREKSVV